MNVIIETEDESEARLLLNARAYYSVLFELREAFRAKMKYSETQETRWDEVYDMVLDMTRDVNLDE